MFDDQLAGPFDRSIRAASLKIQKLSLGSLSINASKGRPLITSHPDEAEQMSWTVGRDLSPARLLPIAPTATIVRASSTRAFNIVHHLAAAPRNPLIPFQNGRNLGKYKISSAELT